MESSSNYTSQSSILYFDDIATTLEEISKDPSIKKKEAILYNFLNNMFDKHKQDSWVLIDILLINVKNINNPTLKLGISDKFIESILPDIKSKFEKPLSIFEFLTCIQRLFNLSGKGSQFTKKEILTDLISNKFKLTQKYLIKWFKGNWDVGVSDKLISKNLYKIATQNQNDIEYNTFYSELLADSKKVINNMYTKTVNNNKVTNNFKIVPIKPMLASPIKSFDDLDENEHYYAEYKYDGVRGQLWYIDKHIYIYSRQLEPLNEMFGDLVNMLETILSNTDINMFVLDGEVMAKINNKFVTFQELMKRRKKNEEKEYTDIPIFIAFDIIKLDNKELFETKLSQRKNILLEILTKINSPNLVITRQELVTNKNLIEQFFDLSMKDNMEGIILKPINSTYIPDKRSVWIKIKKDYIQEKGSIPDSFDLVLMGADFGKGKRSNLYGSFLVGAVNKKLNTIESVCKIGTGLSDELLVEIKNIIDPIISKTKPKEYTTHKNLKVDVWTVPKLILEVQGAEFQNSPKYTLGISDLKTPISLRFPRLKRLRPDKTVETSTPSSELIKYI